MMERMVWTVLVLCAAVVACAAFGHGDEPNKTAELMQKKLKASQKVLEGVAKNDFDAIQANADALIDISNKTEFNSIKSADYEMFSNQFRRTAEGLAKNAKDKNADGVALAYVDLTLVCVKCHKYVRERKMTRLDGEEGRDAVGLR
jgi:cytochrome c556